MRFQDYVVEQRATRERELLLAKVGDREWLLPRDLGLLLVHVRPTPIEGEPHEVRIDYSRWVKSEGATTTISSGGIQQVVREGFFDHAYNGLCSLGLEQLGFVLQARSIIDQWIKGDFNELPIQPFV